MTYELCLEYGTYPLRPVDAWADEINTAPAFITEDKKLLELLEEVNTLFHELFLTIECSFHYIGHDRKKSKNHTNLSCDYRTFKHTLP